MLKPVRLAVALATVATAGVASWAGAAPARALPAARHAVVGRDTAASGNLLTSSSWYADNGTADVAAAVVSTTTSLTGWSVTRSAPVPAVPGSVYTGQLQARTSSVSRQVVPYLYFYDAAGNVLDKVKGEVGQDARTSWTPLVPVVGIAPAKAASVALASLTWGSLTGEVHELTGAALAVRSPTRRAVVGPLRAVGNKVYDANGPVVLRGINRSGLEMSPTGYGIGDEELGQAQRWGATMVRVPLASSYWLTSDCHYDSGYAGRVDAVVRSITGRGMVALLDLHRNDVACGSVAQMPMADATAVTFWQQVAARYASNPLVAFELYNEPHDVTPAVWLHGGPVTTQRGTYTAAGMQDMYDAVRGTGAANLVVVGGLDWADTAPQQLVAGTDVAYAVHAYTCPTGVNASCAPDPLRPPAYLDGWSALSAQRPVLMTEFGWPSGGSGTYDRNVIAYAAARGWGWSAFAWDGTTGGLFSLVSTAGAGASYQPSAAGMPVLTALSS